MDGYTLIGIGIAIGYAAAGLWFFGILRAAKRGEQPPRQ